MRRTGIAHLPEPAGRKHCRVWLAPPFIKGRCDFSHYSSGLSSGSGGILVGALPDATAPLPVSPTSSRRPRLLLKLRLGLFQGRHPIGACHRTGDGERPEPAQMDLVLRRGPHEMAGNRPSLRKRRCSPVDPCRSRHRKRHRARRECLGCATWLALKSTLLALSREAVPPCSVCSSCVNICVAIVRIDPSADACRVCTNRAGPNRLGSGKHGREGLRFSAETKRPVPITKICL